MLQSLLRRLSVVPRWKRRAMATGAVLAGVFILWRGPVYGKGGGCVAGPGEVTPPAPPVAYASCTSGYGWTAWWYHPSQVLAALFLLASAFLFGHAALEARRHRLSRRGRRARQ